MPVEQTYITVIQEPQTIVQIAGNPNYITIPGSVQIITQGTQGPPGPPGSGAVAIANAGAAVTAFQLLALIGGVLIPADPTNVTHAPCIVGIATNSAATGHPVTFALIGELDGFTGLTPNDPYFAGLGGFISATPIATSATWYKSLGPARSSTQLVFIPGPTVLV